MAHSHSQPSFFGQRTYSRSLAGLWLLETRYLPYSRLPVHQHVEPYLCIVLEGGYEETCGNRKLAMGPGALVGHPAGSRHSDEFAASGGRCLNVVPTAAWLQDELLTGWLLEYSHTLLHAPSDVLSRLQRELLGSEDVDALAVAAAVFDFLASARRQARATAQPPWLGRVLDRLDASLARPPSLAELARDAGVHPAHLARTFRVARGESIGMFTRGRRLGAALDELARSRTPLAELALATGFADQAHLARTIKRATGMTPTSYRRSRQNAFKIDRNVQDRAVRRR